MFVFCFFGKIGVLKGVVHLMHIKFCLTVCEMVDVTLY